MLDHEELLHFRERQLQTLMDTCHRLVFSSSFNDLNEEVKSWDEASEDIPCGLDQSAGNERNRTSDIVLQYDAVIRLELSEVWDVRDKIKITKRFGETLSVPITYDIVSPIQRGPSGIRLLLRKVNV